jgi:hypothetical protein
VEESGNRRDGVKLDAARLDCELARRAITGRELCKQAGIPEATLSRARHGGLMREATLRKVSEALIRSPIALGVDLILAEPEEKAIRGKQPQMAHMAGGSADGQSTRVASGKQ